MCEKIRECREIVTRGVSRGWYCRIHFILYMNIVKKTMEEHDCDEAEADKILERLAKELLRKKS